MAEKNEPAHQPVADLAATQLDLGMPLPQADDFDTPWGEAPAFHPGAYSEDLAEAAELAERATRGEAAVLVVDMSDPRPLAEQLDQQMDEALGVPSVSSQYDEEGISTSYVQFPPVDLAQADRDLASQTDDFSNLYAITTQLFEDVDQLRDDVEELEEDLSWTEKGLMADMKFEIDGVYEALTEDLKVAVTRVRDDVREEQLLADEYYERRLDELADYVGEVDLAAGGIKQELLREIDDTESHIAHVSSALHFRDGLLLRSFDMIHTLAQHIDRLDLELAEVRGDADKQRQRINGQAELLQGYTEAVAASLGDNFVADQQLAGQIETLNLRLDETQRAVETVDHRSNQRIDRHGESLERLWEQHHTLRSRQESMHTQVDMLTDTAAMQATAIEQVEDKADRIEDAVNAIMH